MTRTAHTARALLCAALAFAGAAAAEPSEEAVKDSAQFIPARKHEPLPGKVIGVLVGNPQPILALEGRSGPPDALAFSRAAEGYRWIYVPATGDKPSITNLQVPVGTRGEKKVYEKLDMANARTVKRWGLTAPYALVEVEVNSGLGSPAGDSFVATNMKTLDGGKDYPLKVAEVIDRLRRQYQADREGQKKDFDAAMARAQKSALQEQKPTGPRETSEIMHVTWRPESQQLQVRFRMTITDGAYAYGRGVEPADNLGDRPALKRPPPPGEGGVRFGTQFGINWGKGYDVSRTGQVERILTLPVQPFKRVIPPPQ